MLRTTLLIGVAALLASGGCGSKTPTLAAVSGRVCYKGRPLAGGTIVFTPDADRGTTGPLAHAAIRPDGSFTLATEKVPGAAPGWYRIAVAPAPQSPDPPAGTGPVPPTSFRNPKLSGLTREVVAGQENVFDFRLDDS